MEELSGEPVFLASTDMKFKIALADLSKFNILEAGGGRCIFNFSSVAYVQIGIWNESVDICSRAFFLEKDLNLASSLPGLIP